MILAVLGGTRAGAQGQRERGEIDPSLLTPVTATPPGVREQFAGFYRLVSYPPHGNTPSGRIYYGADGEMCAMLLPQTRTALPRAGTPTVEDYQNLNRGLVAYYGTYDVDPPTGRIVHHLQGAWNPEWVGTDFFRWYVKDGDRITLRTSPNAAGMTRTMVSTIVAVAMTKLFTVGTVQL